MKNAYTLVIFLLFAIVAQAQSGLLDTSFGTDGIVLTYNTGLDDAGKATVVQTDGKILVAGYYFADNSHYVGIVVRYNTDGSLDSTFANAGKFVFSEYSNLEAIAVQSDGKILVGGSINTSGSGAFFAARFNNDGSLDNSFGDSGIAIIYSLPQASSGARSIIILDDGKILLGGNIGQDSVVVKLNTDGSLDTSFAGTGISTILFDDGYSYDEEIALQSDGKIVKGYIAHNIVTESTHIMAARLNADGTIDHSFGIDGKKILDIEFIEGFAGLAIQSDGKTILGAFKVFDYDSYEFVAERLNPDGSIDNSYGTNGIATARVLEDGASFATQILIQEDNKLIIAGYITTGIYDYNMAMIRFDTEGNLDTTFGTDGKVSTYLNGRNSWAYGIALQPDNKIILTGGTENTPHTVYSIVVARYTNDVLRTEDYQNDEFRLYPNPAREQLTVETNDASSIYQLEIIDMLGKKVYNTEIQKMGQIDVSALATGTYLVKLNSNSQTATVRFVKQ